MVKKKYIQPSIYIRVIHYHTLGGIDFNVGGSQENVDDARQAKESSSTFEPFSFDDEEEEPNSFYTY